MLSCFSPFQLCVTPWTAAYQAPLFMGLSREEYWSGLSYPPPGDLPDPGIKPMSLVSPALAGGFFTTESSGKPQVSKPIKVLKQILAHSNFCSPSATSCEELTHWKRLWCWERLGAGGEGDVRGWDGWMASPTRWTWVWMNSRSWWWTRRPGVLRFMGSQRVGHDSATELNVRKNVN